MGKVDTRPLPDPGSPEPPPGLPTDPSDANRAANQAQAAEETRQHLAGLTPEQAGEEFFQKLLGGE